MSSPTTFIAATTPKQAANLGIKTKPLKRDDFTAS